MSKRLDFSQIVLNGDGFTQDTFSLTVQAAARLLGRDADYETIYMRSTRPFAPCLRPDEPSRVFWTTPKDHSSESLTKIGDWLGFAVRREALDPDRMPPKPQTHEAALRWLRDHWQKPSVPLVRRSLERGEVPIQAHGWISDHYPWCWWGIITDAHDDGTVIGAGVNGRIDNPLDHPTPFWALSRKEPTVSDSDGDLAMLRAAVSRIRGSVRLHPAVLEERRTRAYGLLAMDHWIEAMKGVPFSPEEPQDGSLAAARCTALPTYNGAKLVAKYLRQHLLTFPAPARPHLEATAKHYERIVELLRPALTGEGGDSYQELMGDPDAQATHVADVLGPIKAALAAAADEIERALALMRVVHDGGKTVLQGFPARIDYHVRGFGELLALQDCMAYAGVDIDWADLLGFSGDAFSCDGMTDLAHLRSHDVASAAAQSYGFELTWGFDNSKPSRPQVHEVLMKGIPIVACGAKLSPQDGGTYCAEWTVIIGDDADRNRHLLAHGLQDHCWALATYNWFGRIPWATGANVRRDSDGVPFYWQPLSGFYLGARSEISSTAQRVIEALRRATEVHRSESGEVIYRDGKESRPVGRGFLAEWPTFFRRWAESAKESDGASDWTEDCYFGLVAHSMRRLHAAAFLRRSAGTLPEAAQAHIKSAASAYENSAQLSEELFKQIAGTDTVTGLDWHGRLRHGPDSLDDGMGEPDVAQLIFEGPPIGRAEREQASREEVAARIREQLRRDEVVESACEKARQILELEDGAIAEIGKALAKAGE